MSTTKAVTIVGAGLGGTLLAIYLARRGFEVSLYEGRGDMRREPVDGGKSIKLTLAERGLSALREVGLEEKVKAECCIPLRGRAVHHGRGAVSFIPYGKDDREMIYSFSRSDLNSLLLDHAETFPNLRCHFHQRCVEIDKQTATAVFRDGRTGELTRVKGDALVGADGSYSTVRQQMQRGERADFSQQFLAWGYKELTFSAGPDGRHQMDKHALHIWPCGDHMLFALPNLDGSFSGVCVLPFQGPHSFAAVQAGDEVSSLFHAHFPDALPLLGDLLTQFSTNPISEFVTVTTSRWHYRDKVVLIGDAAHAVVPFYGQGMNAAFEDCVVLDRCLERHSGDWNRAFEQYQRLRKPHTDVLARLSTENFHELRDTVRRPIVAARKSMAIFLNQLIGQHAMPLYTMISHTGIPYGECVERARRQERIARCMGLDLAVVAVALFVGLRNARARSRALSRELHGVVPRRKVERSLDPSPPQPPGEGEARNSEDGRTCAGWAGMPPLPGGGGAMGEGVRG